MSLNNNLNIAKKSKNDEFYTQLSDIEKEIQHYNNEFFVEKVVYCNCDTPNSNFVKYFTDNFKSLQLKKLIATGYNECGRGTYYEYDGNNTIIRELNGDGDFSSQECTNYLKLCDVVVTNPPFSIFRKYIAYILKMNVKLLVIGNVNTFTHKEIFPYIKNNELWCGCRPLSSDFFFMYQMNIKKS